MTNQGARSTADMQPSSSGHDAGSNPAGRSTDSLTDVDMLQQLRSLPAGLRLLGYTAAEEIERLRTALTGVSTCSTCEACRGAALLALGATETTGDGAK